MIIQLIMKQVKCNLCHSSKFEVIYKATSRQFSHKPDSYQCTNIRHGEYYRLVKCTECGLYYSSPRPDANSLLKGYTSAKDEIYKEELQGRFKTFARNLKNIEKYKKKGLLLDIGCSIGIFLSLAQNKAWKVHGIEPSQWCVDQCKKLFNIKIKKGTYQKLNNTKTRFDVITLWDVLEHLDDPLDALKTCRDLLKKDGLLVFSTLNFRSVYARMLGKKWPWLMKMHIYYFDKKTIKKYLEKAGLKLIQLSMYKHTISINYLLYKLKTISPFLFSLMKMIKKIFLLNKNIYITFRWGDFMTIYARKNN